ncbi:MAG: nucleoside-diphosphate sugar epimerase/dehydratase [Bryobacteraceae bacterium]
MFLKTRPFVIALFYGVMVTMSLFLAYLLRFEFSIPPSDLALFKKALVIAVIAKFTVFFALGRHRTSWRYTGFYDLQHLLLSQVLGSAAFAAANYIVVGSAFPRSVYFIDFLLCFLTKAGTRILIRTYLWELARDTARTVTERTAILIYGAGASGLTLIREIRSNPTLGLRVVGLIDDDPSKYGQKLMGATVLGCGREAAQIVDRFRKRGIDVKEIVIAMPSVSGAKMREALANCRAAQVAVKTIPGMGELLSGKVLTSQLRSVSVEDLLGREPVRLDEGEIKGTISSRVVLVTGGGGSIGSELCRQVARFQPEQLIVLERGETDLFRIHMELTEKFPRVQIIPKICDIREYDAVLRILETYRVNSVFHAAAYKHVPMMESHVPEAVKNNVLGTRNLVLAAESAGVENFLMISSDKAVNPTNIMGLTKRVAEIIVNSMPHPAESPTATKFVSVRFGNVLGSNGSVVPTFEAQIRKGGPVTVTHPEMRRYFMTIPEAVSLVLQASTMGKGSEIFVLDMGEPVRIVDLAKNMIRLSGHEPDVDIEIRYTGLRPGEKLFEELISEGENIMPTYHEKIRIFGSPRLSRPEVDRWLDRVENAVVVNDERELMRLLRDMVPEYRPDSAAARPAMRKIMSAAS